MSDTKEMVDAFLDIVSSGKVDALMKSLSMPNFPIKAINGKVWWNELAECNGWKLQKNTFTQTCRILDPNNVRRAWGGDNAMMDLFNRFKKISGKITDKYIAFKQAHTRLQSLFALK